LTLQDKKSAAPDIAPNWQALASPFDPMELGWRVGRKSHDGDRVQLLVYVTARAVMDRLDQVLTPGGWGNDFRPNPLGGLLCGIWVRVGSEKVWKWDGAEATKVEAVKGGISDSMKRAAVQWGVGRYLYKLDTPWVEVRKGYGRGKAVYVKRSDGPGHALPPVLPAWAQPAARETGPYVPPTPEAFRVELHGQLVQSAWTAPQVHALLATHGVKRACELSAAARAHAMTTITTTNGAAWTASQEQTK